MSAFQFFVNGDWIEFHDFDSDWSLAYALRNRFGLTGTKVACGVGGCGSCTVVISKLDKQSNKFRHLPVNACITPIYSVYGYHVLTIEGLSTNKCVDPLQDALARGNGTQCGFCTPGVVMSLFGLQKELKRDIEVSDIKTALQGNLCRCTGYRPIIEAVQHSTANCANCPDCCNKANDIEDGPESLSRCQGLLQNVYFEDQRKIADSSVKLFKIEKLMAEFETKHGVHRTLQFQTPQGLWLIPRNAKKLGDLIIKYPDAILAGGCTSEKLQKVPKSGKERHVIDLSRIDELKVSKLEESSFKIGAGFTLTEASEEIEETMKVLQADQCTILNCLKECIQCFGSSQIRNTATIGGCLATPHNYSDLQTFCQGFGVKVVFLKFSEEKEDGRNGRVISHIEIPLTQNGEKAMFRKFSKRKDCSTALVNAAILHIPDTGVRVTFGGFSLKRFTLDLPLPIVNDIAKTLDAKIIECFIPSKLAGLRYVQTLARNVIRTISGEHCGAFIDEKTHEFRSTRIFPEHQVTGPAAHDLVHKAVPHASAFKHVTGEATFCDDMPKFQNELEMAFVLSSHPRAKIVSIDFEEAMALDGVVGYVWSDDLLPEGSKFGLVEKDEEIFASEEVTAVGQIIAAVLANDRATACIAAKLVHVEYEDLRPVILTIDEAISHNAYYDKHTMRLSTGDVQKALTTGTHVVSTEIKIGSQEHFYMEPQSCIAIPKSEDGEMEIISSTQNPTGVQLAVASCLGLPANRIVVKVKRVGGGFGGKESRCLLIALPAAVAAHKFGKPVRCVMDREIDMRITGKRNSYQAKQTYAFTDEGKLLALKTSLFANGGNSLDISMAGVERIMLDSAYKIPNLDYEGFVCKTNIPSNTVMRCTGGPQASFLMENIMDTISVKLGKDPVEVRQLHLYSEGDITPYGQELVNCNLRKCWEQCLSQSKYAERRKEALAFNKVNQFTKRGISINPCHYGVGYTAIHLNQGSALVHIYNDGSVLLTHGGVEIGQGVHSKMIQIATRELGIPASRIRVTETSTDKVPNITPSSASVTSDLQGMAVLDACRALTKRLQPYWMKNPDGSWDNVVSNAYMDRVSLTATGFYKVPDITWDGSKGKPFTYFSTGAAATEVQLDCLTGQFKILKTDIVMDVGKSLNPGIDIGQIEGAFVHGMGLFMMEEVIYNEVGDLVTSGPSTYQIPTATDTPLEMNVTFLTDSENPRAIYSSKTVGEPPMILATSVFFAVKDAIRSYRTFNGLDPYFPMDSPATVDKILMACQAPE